MTDILFVLGAADPEMQAIETLLTECGVPWVHAMADGKRVHPGNAYRADCPVEVQGGMGERLDAVYRVECGWDCSLESLSCAVSVIDHHNPGDSGYGRPPAEFLSASSLGQVIAALAQLERHPQSWPLGPETRAAVGEFELWRGCGDITVSVRHRDCALGVTCAIPWDVLYTAAADHCLTAAYSGECPGVHHVDFGRWRQHPRRLTGWWCEAHGQNPRWQRVSHSTVLWEPPAPRPTPCKDIPGRRDPLALRPDSVSRAVVEMVLGRKTEY